MGKAVEGDEDLSAVTLADDGTLLVSTDGGSLSLWRPGNGDDPYVTFPFIALPDELHPTADHLTYRHGNSELTIPLNPEAWHKTLCRHWTPYTPEELRILHDSGAATDSPCP